MDELWRDTVAIGLFPGAAKSTTPAGIRAYIFLIQHRSQLAVSERQFYFPNSADCPSSSLFCLSRLMVGSDTRIVSVKRFDSSQISIFPRHMIVWSAPFVSWLPPDPSWITSLMASEDEPPPWPRCFPRFAVARAVHTPIGPARFCKCGFIGQESSSCQHMLAPAWPAARKPERVQMNH